MFRLQRFFSATSLILILITAVVLGVFYRHLSISLLLDDGENKNVAITQVLANGLSAQLEDVLSAPSLMQDEASVSQLKRQRLHAEIEKLISGLPVVKIKLYTPSGMTVYSTDPAQIGDDQQGNSAIQLARNGVISSSFVERDEFNEFDQQYARKDLLQTYLPLYAPASHNLQGVFEVYSDYTPLLTRIARLQWLVMLGNGIILMLLYTGLLLIVRHAQGVIQRQELALHGTVEELESIRTQLENRVAERTRTLADRNHQLAQEVEQRTRVEKHVRDREQRLQAVMDNLLNAILVCDEQGSVESINPSAEKLFGFPRDALLGRDLRSLLTHATSLETEPGMDNARGLEAVSESEQEPVAGDENSDSRTARQTGASALIHDYLDGLIGTRTELFAVSQSGECIPVESAVTRTCHEGQSFYIISIRDLSAQKLAELTLAESRRKLQHQEKMAAIGSLSAGIVHEIGNPIAAIDGLLEGICHDESPGCQLTAAVRADLDLIRQQTQRLIKINRDVSEFSSPQGQVRELLDFNNLVGRTCRLMRYDQRLKNAQLRLDLDPSLPAITLYGDQLIQVLMNLITNAADAVNSCPDREGEILVSTRCESRGISLSVQDNGAGMDPETVQHALDAFYTTKGAGKGTGLGLSICNSIVQLHGGEIDIQSDVGQGCLICIKLPLAD